MFRKLQKVSICVGSSSASPNIPACVASALIYFPFLQIYSAITLAHTIIPTILRTFINQPHQQHHYRHHHQRHLDGGCQYSHQVHPSYKAGQISFTLHSVVVIVKNKFTLSTIVNVSSIPTCINQMSICEYRPLL